MAQPAEIGQQNCPNPNDLGCVCLPWYVLFCQPAMVFRARSAVGALFQTYLPMMVLPRLASRNGRPIWQDGKRVTQDALQVLFPGYFFVSFDTSGDDWGAANRQPGGARIISHRGQDQRWQPERLPNGFVEHLRLRGRSSDGAIDDRELPPDLTGHTLKALSGPFANFEGICKMSAVDRVTVLHTFFGRSVPVEYERSDVERVA